jgi:hypothetical protein
MSRPFLNAQIGELEAAFDRRRTDVDFLRRLIDELSHRSTGRAARLKAKAVEALAAVSKPTNLEWSPSAGDPRHEKKRPPKPTPPPPQTAEPDDSAILTQKPMPEISNLPAAVLSAWTALEVLSPPSFRRPEELANGDKRAVARLDSERLPWEGDGERARPNTKLYYEIVLGMVDIEGAVRRLIKLYGDTRVERPAARGEAVLAAILVNREGQPIEGPATAVSSFGWGIPRALSGSLEALGAWQQAQKPLLEALDKVIRQADANGDSEPLDAGSILNAYEWLVFTLGLPWELVKPPASPFEDTNTTRTQIRPNRCC